MIIPDIESCTFPHYKHLSLSDRVWFTQFVTQFPPYSDFNFVSLYSYDIAEDARVSFLNGNLVVKFRDYLTNEPFYTFLGNNNLRETVSTLLMQANEEHILPRLQLVPAFIVEQEPRLFDLFSVTEDRDNFDYILHLPQIATLQGSAFANKRNLVNKFHASYPSSDIHVLSLSDTSFHEQIMTVFKQWVAGKQATEEETHHELHAIKRLLSASHDLPVVAVGVTINQELKGFAIGEKIDNKHGIFHFVKGDRQIRGISEVLYKHIAIALLDLGCEFMNFEQDLGIPGLRLAKEQWNPVGVLKKYIVAEKTVNEYPQKENVHL